VSIGVDLGLIAKRIRMDREFEDGILKDKATDENVGVVRVEVEGALVVGAWWTRVLRGWLALWLLSLILFSFYTTGEFLEVLCWWCAREPAWALGGDK